MKSLQQHKESGEYLSDTRPAASSVNQTATSNANEKNSNLQSNSQGVPDNKQLYSKVVVGGSVGPQETHESFDGTHSQATLNTVSESNRVDLSTGAEGTDSSDGEDKQTLVQQGPTMVPKESEGLAMQTPPAKDAELSENQAPAQQELPTVLKGSEETVTENASGLSARDDITENDSVNDTKVSNGHSIHLEQDASLVNQASTSNGNLPSSNQSISKGVDLNNGAENTDSGGGGNKQSSITSELSTSITVTNNNGFSEQEDNGMITSKVSSNSEENSPESMHRSVTDNSEQLVSSSENSENELSDYQGKSEKLSNTEADVEPLVRGNGHIGVVSTAISNQPNSVSNDDETKRDSVQSAAHVEQIDDRQVPLIQNHSRLENNQQDLQSEVSPTVDNGNPNNIAFTNENVEMPTPEQKSDTKIDVKQSADSNNGSVTTPSVQPALPESVDKNSGKEDTQLKSTVVHLVANEDSEQVNNTQGNNKQHSYSGKNNTEGFDRNEALRQDNLVSPERNQGQFSSGIAQGNASTPTYENVSGSNSANNSSINEANLSDRIGVDGASIMAEPVNLIVTELEKLKGIGGEEQLLREPLQEIAVNIVKAVSALTLSVEKLINGSSKARRCEDESESSFQVDLALRRRLEIQNRANTHLDVEYQELSEQASRLEEDNGRLSNEKDRISKKNDQLEGDLSISEQRLSKTSQTLKNTEGQLKKTKKELDDAKEDVSKLEREVSDKQAGIDILIGKIGKITDEKDQLKGELDRKVTEFKEKEKALNAANGRVSKLEQDLEQRKRLLTCMIKWKNKLRDLRTYKLNLQKRLISSAREKKS